MFCDEHDVNNYYFREKGENGENFKNNFKFFFQIKGAPFLALWIFCNSHIVDCTQSISASDKKIDEKVIVLRIGTKIKKCQFLLLATTSSTTTTRTYYYRLLLVLLLLELLLQHDEKWITSMNWMDHDTKSW